MHTKFFYKILLAGMVAPFCGPLVALFITLLVLPACHSSDPRSPHVVIQSQAGEIEIELYPLQAPKSAGAFLSYVDSGFYKNASFYRVLNDDNQPMGAPKSELIQGGIWRTNNRAAVAHQHLPHETTRQTNILHTNGVISLARTEPGTAGTEFFICVGDQPGFDYGGENNPDGQGYAAFGKVIRGMDIVKAIYERPENNQSFDPPVVIFNITRK